VFTLWWDSGQSGTAVSVGVELVSPNMACKRLEGFFLGILASLKVNSVSAIQTFMFSLSSSAFSHSNLKLLSFRHFCKALIVEDAFLLAAITSTFSPCRYFERLLVLPSITFKIHNPKTKSKSQTVLNKARLLV